MHNLQCKCVVLVSREVWCNDWVLLEVYQNKAAFHFFGKLPGFSESMMVALLRFPILYLILALSHT